MELGVVYTMKIRTKLASIGFVPIIFFMSLLCVGMFHEYISCMIGLIILVWLFLKLNKEKQLIFRINNTSIAIVVIVLSYLISILWAVDSGMAFIGFLKFLPILLFLISIFQEKGSTDKIMELLPCIATVMTVLSMVGMFIPGLDHYFNVADRLAGFFQYPNTFAIFLLVAELTLLSKEKLERLDYIYIPVIIVGLLFTGSRTVFVLALISNVLLFMIHRDKRIRVFGIACVIIGVVCLLVYVLIFDGTGSLSRLFRMSLTESTFVGRVLYYIDALPVILKHPFGLGYMGYYYMQQSIQTGVYSVLFIHNDFLQIMLDVGWIPCILFMIAIIKSIFSKNISRERKLILLVMVLHSCFDFNLQFIAVFFLFILFMDGDSGKEMIWKKKIVEMKTIFIVLSGIFFWCGLSLALYHVKEYKAACALYPWNTQSQTMLLSSIKDVDALNELADNILGHNEYVAIGYSAKARYAYAKGDFESLMKYKNTLFEKAPFQYSEYEEYCYMLINGISLYMKAGDEQSAQVCAKELLNTYERVTSLGKRLSKYGKMIKDQPVTELPEDIVEYVNALKKQI